jgi:hypothetical protein|tara:strand:- start:240 stop:746 length:507 start_codon:yes stop_codon:yes gene_type:complete
VPRKVIRRLLPKRVNTNQKIGCLKRWLGSENLWHLNRRSVARGAAIGCFWALVPVPMHTPLAALSAAAFRANLPVTIVAVWLSNPLTMVPLYGSGFLLGAYLLGTPLVPVGEMSIPWLLARLPELWLGCGLLSVLAGGFGYGLVNLLWRLKVNQNWQQRRAARQCTRI